MTPNDDIKQLFMTKKLGDVDLEILRGGRLCLAARDEANMFRPGDQYYVRALTARQCRPPGVRHRQTDRRAHRRDKSA